MLPTDLSVKFWEQYVEPSYDMIFSDMMWSTNNHACWLALVKVTVKLLSNDLPKQHAARLMQMVARVYPLSEKSGVKVWGSVNTENVTEMESATFFETQQADLVVTDKNEHALGDDDGAITDYSFYESFWKLQQDFHNPNAIAVADFLKRLQTFFSALESHKPDILVDKGETSRITRKYLTSSRLLVTQLRDIDFRLHVLTQFLITAHHLTSQVDSLTSRLSEHIIKAKHLMKNMGTRAAYHLKIVESLLETLEPQWRRWKQNKCKPDLDVPRQNTTGQKRKQISQVTLDESVDLTIFKSHSHYSVAEVQKDLPYLARKMRSVVPSVENHLEDYVEALDPDSGIEAEYHPKNESLFSWRALRLLSDQHVGRQFGKIGPNGDFEVAVRDIYKEEKNVEIPGKAPVYDEIDLDEMCNDNDLPQGHDSAEQNEDGQSDDNNDWDQDVQDESMLQEAVDASNKDSENNIDDDVAGTGNDDGVEDLALSDAGENANEIAEAGSMEVDEANHHEEDEVAIEGIPLRSNGFSENGTADQVNRESVVSDGNQNETLRAANKIDSEGAQGAIEGLTSLNVNEAEKKREVAAARSTNDESRRSPPRSQVGLDNQRNRQSPPRGSDNRENRRSPPRGHTGPDNRDNRRSPPKDDRRERRFDGGRRGDGSQVESRPGRRGDGFDSRRGPTEDAKDSRGRGNQASNRGSTRDHDRGRDTDRRGGHERPRNSDADRGRAGVSGRGDDTTRGPPQARERRGEGDWKNDLRRGGRRR
ncbi:THO complex subunit 1 [Fistulifera solaris]|uniref:THO complex subunit 1 n=1 Tax=Fistulifera solaris TaxID=1519565 RepID=A0A1Z5JNG7_FISSO|nr:THO complex subunit 1 [Fistulifera solaris]|eukprot:GAX15534.1 THO complex subunit 1 [Fistulifera solaris]